MSPRDPSYDLESPGLRWDLAYAWSAFVGLLRALWGRVRGRTDEDARYSGMAPSEPG